MRTQLSMLALLLALLVGAGPAFAQPDEEADEQWVGDSKPPAPPKPGDEGEFDGVVTDPKMLREEVLAGPPLPDDVKLLDDGCCHGSECCLPCCTPVWAHKCGGFGDFLFLRPRNAEIPFAVPIDGPITQPPNNNPIQIGRTATIDPNYSPGFRVGAVGALSRCASLRGTYTHYENSEANSIATEAPNVIRSLVSHPSSMSAATDFLSARATSSINFLFADLDYRGLWLFGPRHAVNYVVGARYAHLNQDFGAIFTDNGTETVTSAVNFDGGGIRVGLEAERFARNTGVMIYGRGMASFVAGQFRGSYFQGQSFDPSVVETNWNSGRLVSILDLEIGLGWTSPNQRLRLRAGYLVSGWFNAVKTVDFIKAVQTSDFTQLSNPLSFDGLTAGAEVRF